MSIKKLNKNQLYGKELILMIIKNFYFNIFFNLLSKIFKITKFLIFGLNYFSIKKSN